MRREEERFWAKVDRRGVNECWPWLASKVHNGYGQFWLRAGRLVLSHRYVYELMVGAIPDGLQLDHLCRNPSCVNPAHLEPVTQRENILRGTSPLAQNARKIRCAHGHAFSSENTYVWRDTKRVCRACKRRRDRQSRLEERAGGQTEGRAGDGR